MANEVVHFEINGKNIDTLKAFYTGLFGWEAQDWPMPGGHPYVGFDTKEMGGIGGGLTVIPDGAPPMATCYISVEDLAASLAAVEAAGGQTVVPITDVGMVVFALFADPQGNVVGLVKTGAIGPAEARELVAALG